MSRPLSLACGALLLLLPSGNSMAADPDGNPAEGQVDLMVGATATEARLLEPPIRSILTTKGLRVTTTRTSKVTAADVAAAIAPPTGVVPTVARVLLDFTVAGKATLFLIDARRGRVYARRMLLEHGLDAVARAGALFVVEQSIDAILEGREIGVTREEYERSVVPPPPPPRPPSEPLRPVVTAPGTESIPAPGSRVRHFVLAGGYEGPALGGGEFGHAAKIGVGVRWTHLQFAGTARLALPLAIAGDGVRARLTTGGIGVSAAGRVPISDKISLMAGLAVGLDVTRVEPTVMTSDLQPTMAFWARGPLLKPFLELERLFGRLSVAITVGAEVHPLAERYTVRVNDEVRDVFVPWRVRPTAALLVGVTF